MAKIHEQIVERLKGAALTFDELRAELGVERAHLECALQPLRLSGAVVLDWRSRLTLPAKIVADDERLTRKGAIREGYPDTKRCRSCSQDLPRRHFHNSKSASDGLQAECKACRRERGHRDSIRAGAVRRAAKRAAKAAAAAAAAELAT